VKNSLIAGEGDAVALSAHLEPPGFGQPVPSKGETGEAFEIESSSATKASREEACKTFIH
jgi:hypothetical protein